MIAILDYDAGNTASVVQAFRFLGEECVLTRDEAVILAADGVVLPGVGAFADAMERIREYGFDRMIPKIVGSGKPFLGICLGLQLLFDASEEVAQGSGMETVPGLGILPGTIRRFPSGMQAGEDLLKIPHMGWNQIQIREDSRLFRGIPSGSFVYFVHSYYLDAVRKEDVAATSDYGIVFDAAAEHENVFACQFHPEKSGEVGLKILRNFVALTKE